MVYFGQLVIGPPGCGKTTYCNGMQQYLNAVSRKTTVVNLDFANEISVPYETEIDVNELISTSSVMKDNSLGPNGALVYCMEYLESNTDWLVEKIRAQKGDYILIDCPGQTELYTQHESLRKVITTLQKQLDLRLVCVHLVDSVLCTDIFKYLSALLVALSGQTFLELPHINVLSKVDVLTSNRMTLDHRIEKYAAGDQLMKMADVLFQNKETSTHPFDMRFEKFTRELCEVLEDFGMLSFRLLNIQDELAVREILEEADRANGYSILPREYRSDEVKYNTINDYLNPDGEDGGEEILD